MDIHDVELRVEAVQLSWTANAYSDSAIRLCESLIEGDDQDSVYENRVVLHLVYLGVELFYKAGLAAFNKPYAKSHDLRHLRNVFGIAAPDSPLVLPNFVEQLMSQSDHLLDGVLPPQLDRQFERYRYYSDRNGRPFPNLGFVDLVQLRGELNLLKKSTLGLTVRIWTVCGYVK